MDGTTKFISADDTAIIPPIRTKNLTESKAAKPSIPSIKLNAFTTTIKTKIVIKYEAKTGISYRPNIHEKNQHKFHFAKGQ